MAKPIKLEDEEELDFENGLMGGFSDEPMKFPPFDMGKGPLPGKGRLPGFLDGMEMPPMEDGTDCMPPIDMPGPLDMLKMKICQIKVVEDVKVSFKLVFKISARSKTVKKVFKVLFLGCSHRHY